MDAVLLACARLLTATGTSHVPCKFYRQGACQAGKACPFLHSDEPVTERAPCKYFTKASILGLTLDLTLDLTQTVVWW